MKSVVRHSIFSWALSVGVIVLFVIGLVSLWGTDRFNLFAVLVGAVIVFALLYAPVYISANESQVKVHSPLRNHTLSIDKIASVEPFYPTMGTLRLFASGGLFGYYGLFRDRVIGNYIGFHGKSSDCFLIRMKNGDKYVLGCHNPGAMTDYIKSKIKQ